MNSIKILHFVNTLDIGGATGDALNIAQVLPADRFEVYFCSGPGSTWRYRAEDVSQEVFQLDTMRPTHRTDVNTPISGDFQSVIELVRILNGLDIDIIHSHGSKSRLLGGLAGRMANIPVRLQTAHGFAFNSFTPFTKKFPLYCAELFVCRILYHKTIVVSDFHMDMARHLRLAEESSLQRIYYGVDTNKFRPPTCKAEIRRDLGLPQNASIATMVGRLAEQKDPLCFVNIAKQVIDKNSDALFLLVGDGPLRTEVENATKGYQNRIRLLGSRSDIPDLLRASDVFVLTSRWEGLPISILEAQATSLPVVATRIDGTPEAVIDGQTGYCVTVGNTSAFVKSIQTVLNNPESAHVMGKNARELVLKRHTLGSMTSAYMQLYQDIYRSSEFAEY